VPVVPTPPTPPGAAVLDRWAAAGGLWLTGRADGPPLGPPAPLVAGVDALTARLAARSAALGRAVVVDGLALLTERAAITGHRRGGRWSCGGATRLVEAADGWLAVALARPADREVVPAWLGVDPAVLATTDPDRSGDPEVPGGCGGPGGPGAADGPAAAVWAVVEERARERPVDELVRFGAELGLPIGRLGEAEAAAPRVTDLGAAAPVTDLSGVLVVDLSALWAGPLCGSLLAVAGARVVKVESPARPDGARSGPAAFDDLLNGAKRSVALDLRTAGGRQRLAALLRAADVVIEGSRPRALAQLGIDAAALVRDGGPRAWLSITGHGRGPDAALRVGFGDDAAVAGGLVAFEGDRPRFVADAIADPLTGLTAAVAVLDALAEGGRRLLDVALAEVAAGHTGPTLAVPGHLRPTPPPPARAAPGPAAPLGRDTAAVLAELGIEP